jgi:hypothetical protein
MSMDAEATVVVSKKKERSKTHHGSPRKPEMVLDIIAWRDKQRMTWQAIGDKFDITRAGARHLYMKWHKWSKEE